MEALIIIFAFIAALIVFYSVWKMDNLCPKCYSAMRKTPPCDYVCDKCGYRD